MKKIVRIIVTVVALSTLTLGPTFASAKKSCCLGACCKGSCCKIKNHTK
jgi:hypothetical protein